MKKLKEIILLIEINLFPFEINEYIKKENEQIHPIFFSLEFFIIY
jgi:hypothetical protein